MKRTLKIDPDRAAAEMCKRHLSEFVKEFWDVIIEDPLEWAPHMDVMCDEIQVVYERVFLKDRGRKNEEGKPILERLPKLYDLIINIPPGTSKSTICTVMAPAWSWTRDASLRHITGSYSDSLSTEHSVKSRDIVRSDRYRLYFPDVELKKDEDNKTNYKNTRKGQRFTTSVGSAVTGVHAHIITFDDPLNPKQAASEPELKGGNEFLDKTLSTRKVDKRVTPLILVMQRLATNDPTGHLLEKKPDSIRKICLPGTLTDDVAPKIYRKIYTMLPLPAGHPIGHETQAREVGFLDPHRLGPESLKEMRIDLGSGGYAGQVNQRPAPAGGLIWQKWLREIPDEQYPDITRAVDLGTDWDLAYTSDEENAASSFVKSGKIAGQVYIWDFDWRWLEFPQLLKWMKAVGGPHYIEAKASGKSAKQTLSQQGVIAIEVQVKGGGDKLARARMATPIAESGIVNIRKSMADRLYNNPEQGILAFPRNKYKDLADALAQALQRHSKTNQLTVAGERGDYSDDPLDWD